MDAFLTLVRLGIGNAATASLPESVDWDAIEAFARRHGLLGIVYDGVVSRSDSAESTGLLLETKLRWIGEVVQGYEQRYESYRKAVVDLASFYHSHGFRMMVLKGLACGINWPKPEHRPYGDIDVYLFGQYNEADALLTRDFGVRIDNSHHHHTLFKWEGFTVENHYDFVNVHVHRSSRELEAIFKRLADSCLPLAAYCLQPSESHHALFLLRHMVSHFTGASINLRQVLDWGFFVKAHHGSVDWQWLVEILDKYHMKDFYDCINAICVEDLGFDAAIFPDYQAAPIAKERILNDTLAPEFAECPPRFAWKRIPFKYRRWKANQWKRELCYYDDSLRTFLEGVWTHMLKPTEI